MSSDSSVDEEPSVFHVLGEKCLVLKASWENSRRLLVRLKELRSLLGTYGMLNKTMSRS